MNGGAGSGGYSTGSVASRDGRVIGLAKSGQGPGIIAVYGGGMQAAQNLAGSGLLSESMLCERTKAVLATPRDASH